MNYKSVIALVLFILTYAVVVASATPQGSSVVEGAVHSPRVCFPKKGWGPAPDKIRPCVRITRVEEDGSFQFAVSDGDGTVRYTSGVGALDR